MNVWQPSIGDRVVTPSGYTGEVRDIQDGIAHVLRDDVAVAAWGHVPYDLFELAPEAS